MTISCYLYEKCPEGSEGFTQSETTQLIGSRASFTLGETLDLTLKRGVAWAAWAHGLGYMVKVCWNVGVMKLCIATDIG